MVLMDGLFDMLDRVFIDHYINDIKHGVQPKKAIIFCRGNGVLRSTTTTSS
jgi:hypothetical protein